MRNLLSVLCSMVVCYASLTEANTINCKEPGNKVASEQEFKLNRCDNSDNVCFTHYIARYGGDKAVFKFTAPEGKVLNESHFECQVAQYKEKNSDRSVSYTCQKGEQKSIGEYFFTPRIEPFKGGETRFIACYCGPDDAISEDSRGYVKAELIVSGIMEKCYIVAARNAAS